MNQVNFLPESFIRAQARKKRVFRQGVLVAIAAGLLVAGWLIQAGAGVAQNQYCLALEDRVATARQMKTELTKLREEHAALQHQRKIQRELAQPVSHTQVIATISRMLPQSIAMTELKIVAERPKPQQRVAQGATPKRTRGGSAEARPAAAEPDVLNIELEALAPDGESVAALVKAFADHPLFSDVWMRHSRAVEARGVIAREFRLELRVDLDRRFEITPMRKEVARAD